MGYTESFFIPFAVILAVPCGLTGSFLFAQFFGLENNVYMQTGIIMLIGLLAKTAILRTEYATKRREAGMSLVQAAYTAAKVRLRPILMTLEGTVLSPHRSIRDTENSLSVLLAMPPQDIERRTLDVQRDWDCNGKF